VPKASRARTTEYRPSGGDRVFADERGRLWNAAYTGEAIVFTCVSDGRQSGRALAIPAGDLAGDVGDDKLREWLDHAPHIGTLT
jgi:hypothetical protein